jgi:hypothetical protein
MTSSFPHRFARVFRGVQREQLAMPLEDQFHLCRQRLHEHEVNNLLARLTTLSSPTSVRQPERGGRLEP